MRLAPCSLQSLKEKHTSDGDAVKADAIIVVIDD
jgi:hypothetical protein